MRIIPKKGIVSDTVVRAAQNPPVGPHWRRYIRKAIGCARALLAGLVVMQLRSETSRRSPLNQIQICAEK